MVFVVRQIVLENIRLKLVDLNGAKVVGALSFELFNTQALDEVHRAFKVLKNG